MMTDVPDLSSQTEAILKQAGPLTIILAAHIHRVPQYAIDAMRDALLRRNLRMAQFDAENKRRGMP